MTSFYGDSFRGAPGRAPLGACEFCGEDAHCKAIMRKGTSAKAKNVRLAREALVCPAHAESFWKQGVEIR